MFIVVLNLFMSNKINLKLFSDLPKRITYLLIFNFVFVIILNLFSIIPYSYSIIWTLFILIWGLFNFLLVVFSLISNNIKNFICHFLPFGTPVYLWFVLIIIEFISFLIRPLFLGIRLIINLSSGHIILHIIIESIYVFIFFLLFILLEMSICFIQSYVYILLLYLYNNRM